MVRNRHLARALSDVGMHEFRRQTPYKARLYGARIVVAARWYASSKTCSCCGVIKPTLDLAARMFRCDGCGFEAGRDVNAALNLAAMAASSAVTACGEERSGVRRLSRVKRASAKQEESSDLKQAA
jgi:putative transposase